MDLIEDFDTNFDSGWQTGWRTMGDDDRIDGQKSLTLKLFNILTRTKDNF
jgi:hypothetical protein